jgi:DNA-binding LacI/PurR family transcriptional regulator
MPTIRQIAQAAGVSPATVSLVMHDSPRVSGQTRELVEHAIKTLGYEPRQAGRPRKEQSRKGGQQTYLFVANRPLVAFKQALLYLDVLHGINSCLAENQATTRYVSVDPDKPMLSEIQTDSTQGMIVLGPELIEPLRALVPGIPLVQVMGAPLFNEQWDHVTCNNQLVGELAAAHLRMQGHRSIAILKVDDQHPAHTQRIAAFENHAQAHGMHVKATEKLVMDDNVTLHSQLLKPLQRLFKSKGGSRPTALFTAADMYAVATYPALSTLGLRPGHDVHVVSANHETNLFTGLNPQPASVDLHAFDIGFQSALALLRRIQAPRIPTSLQLIAPSLSESDEN